jgi:RNA polymerase sigma factor (sigma-70 family)
LVQEHATGLFLLVFRAFFNQPKTYVNNPHPQLWQGLQQGDEHAVAALMRAYYADLYRYGLRIVGQGDLVKDGIQDIFAYLWQHRTTLASVTNVKAYLLKSLRRHLLRLVQRQAKQATTAPPEETDIVFSPEDFIIAAELDQARRTRLATAVNQLTKRQREAIFLRFYADLTTPEIAETMGLAPQSLYNLLSEALRALKRILASLALVLVGAWA